MAGVPNADELERAIREFLGAGWPAFVPAVKVESLRPTERGPNAGQTYIATLILSDDEDSEDALREALTRVEAGFHEGKILAGRLSGATLRHSERRHERRAACSLEASLRFTPSC